MKNKIRGLMLFVGACLVLSGCAVYTEPYCGPVYYSPRPVIVEYRTYPVYPHYYRGRW